MVRAAPLPPEERREAILDAVLPLVLNNGTAISTREIAKTCGVAEGTIFRVFATKQELIDEVIGRALSPERILESLASLPDTSDVTRRVCGIVATLQAYASTIQQLMPILHAQNERRAHDHHKPGREMGEVTILAITAALAPFAGSLSVSASTAAAAIFALSLGSTFTQTGPSDPDTITAVLLHGIAAHDLKA